MTLELVPKDAPCYDGSRLCFVDKEHFVHQSGSLLRVMSAKTSTTVGFVASPVPCTRGISAYGASVKGKVIAIARRSVPPAIDVVAWPGAGAVLEGAAAGAAFDRNKLGRDRKAVATGGCGLEYAAVGLSRRGERLAAVSGVADCVLTVWDVPQGRSSGVLDAASGRVAQARRCASVELPCACDTVSFNPANPSMVMCTASSHRHDGVGGGHAGGCFVFKLATSHGHTSLTRVDFDLKALPLPFDPIEDARLRASAARAQLLEDGDEEEGFDEEEAMPGQGAAVPGATDDDDEDDEEKALKCVFRAVLCV